MIISILLSSMALAAVTVSPTTSTLKLDYAGLGEDDKRLDFTSEEITLTNTGSASESVSLSLTTLNDDFRDLAVSSSSFDLTMGEVKKITLSGEAPANLDYDYNGDFAKLTITTAASTVEVNFKANPKQMVEVDKVYVYLDEIEENDYKDGDTVDGIAPGDQVELRFILSNRYDNDYEKGDITGNIEVDLSDLDLEDGEADFNLAAGDEFGQSDAPRLNFTIPLDADEDEYNININFKDMKSVSGAEFEDIDMDLTFSVEKESDMVRLGNLILSPSEVSCSRRIEISGTLTNTGSDNQRYADVTLFSSELGIDKRFDYSLNEGKSQTFTYYTELNSTVKASLYPIRVTGYVDSTKPKDGQILELNVKDCGGSSSINSSQPKTAAPPATSTAPIKNTFTAASTATTSTATSAASNKPAVTGAATTALLSSSEIVKTMEKSYTQEDYLAALMLVGSVFAIVMIIVFAMILLKPDSRKNILKNNTLIAKQNVSNINKHK